MLTRLQATTQIRLMHVPFVAVTCPARASYYLETYHLAVADGLSQVHDRIERDPAQPGEYGDGFTGCRVTNRSCGSLPRLCVRRLVCWFALPVARPLFSTTSAARHPSPARGDTLCGQAT